MLSLVKIISSDNQFNLQSDSYVFIVDPHYGVKRMIYVEVMSVCDLV